MIEHCRCLTRFSRRQSLRPLGIACLFGLGLVSLGGCDEGSEVLDVETEDFRAPREAVMGVGYCPPELCGSNSDVAGAFSFNARSTDPSAANMVLQRVIAPGGEAAQLWLRRDRIELQVSEHEYLVDEAVIGAQLVFAHTMAGAFTGEVTVIHIDDVELDAVEAWNGSNARYSTYTFSYRRPQESEEARRPLCAEYPWANADNELDTTAGILVQGERYDWLGQTMPLEEPGDWATIGCLGGAYAKKVLMGYDPHHVDLPLPPHYTSISGTGLAVTPGSSSNEESLGGASVDAPELGLEDVPDLDQNETMMRLLTARYCDGENHTEPGTPLFWANEWGWTNIDPEESGPALELEALWTPEGAACLNTPRLVDRAVVEADCGSIPSCEGFAVEDYHLASYRAL